MTTTTLGSTARALIASGKGILAADESFPTLGKRFATLAIPSTEENRRDYREWLFTTPNLGEFISGAILFEETIRQMTSEGTSMPEILAQQGVIPGIKVDAGAVGLAGFPGEKLTQGLDGLRENLAAYREGGGALHQVASSDYYRRIPADDGLYQSQCGGARLVRGPQSGSGTGPYCRARGADGR